MHPSLNPHCRISVAEPSTYYTGGLCNDKVVRTYSLSRVGVSVDKLPTQVPCDGQRRHGQIRHKRTLTGITAYSKEEQEVQVQLACYCPGLLREQCSWTDL